MSDYRAMRRALIDRHEGTGPMRGGRFMPYKDSRGKLTIGHGRCFEDIGISQDEANYLFENDLIAAENVVESLQVGDIGDARRAALVDMAFNLGGDGLRGFVQMLAALRRGDWQGAHDAALDSRWARQVDPLGRSGAGRDDDIAQMLLTGEWPAWLK